jgi:hypothetical protein
MKILTMTGCIIGLCLLSLTSYANPRFTVNNYSKYNVCVWIKNPTLWQTECKAHDIPCINDQEWVPTTEFWFTKKDSITGVCQDFSFATCTPTTHSGNDYRCKTNGAPSTGPRVIHHQYGDSGIRFEIYNGTG